MTDLHLAGARRNTFQKGRKGAAKSLNWPFPLPKTSTGSTIHADHLAYAGFHHAPTPTSPTRTVCFLCETGIDDWVEGDDPIMRHLAANPACGYALCVSSVWDKIYPRDEWAAYWGKRGERWPRGDKMLQAREHTFSVGWPHHGERGVPTAKAIAAAGWYFGPGPSEDSVDQCKCPYCSRSVAGWEAGDDPVALHRRKNGLKCPFFLAPEPVVAEQEAEESDEVDAGGIRLVDDEEPARRGTTGKGKKASSRSDSSRANLNAPVEEDEEPQSQRPARPRRGAGAPSSDNSTFVADVAPPKKNGRATRASKKPEVLMVSSPPPTASSLPRSRVSKALSIATEPDVRNPVSRSRSQATVVEGVEDNEEEESEPVTTTRKPTRGSSKPPVVAAEQADLVKKLKAKKPSAKKFAKQIVDGVEGDDVTVELVAPEHDLAMDVEEPRGQLTSAPKSRKHHAQVTTVDEHVTIDHKPMDAPLLVEGAAPVHKKKVPSSKAKSKSNDKGKATSTPSAPLTPANVMDVFSDERMPFSPKTPAPPAKTSNLIIPPRVSHADVYLRQMPTAFTEEELAMTVEQAFDHSGQRAYALFEQELDRHYQELEARFAAGARRIQALIDDEEQRQGQRDRERPRQRL